MSTKVRTSPTKTPAAGPMSKAEFARQMHVTRQAVSTWIARKQLKWPALRRDGRVDVAKARAMLAGAAAGLGREGAAARAGAAEDAMASRLARARADLLAVKADEREFSRAVADGVYISVDDASRPIARMLADLMSALETWVLRAPELILSTDDDDIALARLRNGFDQAWLRVRGVDDRPRNGQVHPVAVSDVRKEAVEDTIPTRVEGAGHAPGRREDEAARLARMRCEKAESAAADALRAFRQHLGQYCDAAAWRIDVAAGFCGIRAQIEGERPALVTVVRAAGDRRPAAIVARGWLRAVRSQVAGRARQRAAA
jgi:hypothetical protein